MKSHIISVRLHTIRFHHFATPLFNLGLDLSDSTRVQYSDRTPLVWGTVLVMEGDKNRVYASWFVHVQQNELDNWKPHGAVTAS